MLKKMVAVILCVTFIMAAAPAYAADFKDEFGNPLVVDGVDLGYRLHVPEVGDPSYNDYIDYLMESMRRSSKGSRDYSSSSFSSSVVIGGTANPAIFTLTGAGVGLLKVVSPYQAAVRNQWESVDLAYQLRNTGGTIVDYYTIDGYGTYMSFSLGFGCSGDHTMAISNRSSHAATVSGSLSWGQ